MALSRNINKNFKSQENTGFGTNSNLNAGRFLKKNGKPNIDKKGIGLLEKYSLFHTLLDVSPTRFLFIIFGFFTLINIIFAFVYYCIGMEHLGGIEAGTPLENFGEAFFFSTQTFTTVGYGRINPQGILTSSIAALEALTGLLSFAVVTGLFYGRFSRPRAFLRFSNKMLVSPYKNGSALMFRMVPFKNNQLSEATVNLTLAMKVEENGVMVNKFYGLALEINTINSLTLSWTIVHALTDTSPIYKFTAEDLVQAQAEFLVYVKAFDEAFSNSVIARTSYTAREIAFGERFNIMYDAAEAGDATLLHIDRLNETIAAPIPATTEKEE